MCGSAWNKASLFLQVFLVDECASQVSDRDEMESLSVVGHGDAALVVPVPKLWVSD